MMAATGRVRRRELKQRERLRSALQRVPANMSVSLRDGRAFVSDQGHHDSIGNSGVFKQKAGSAWQYTGAGGAALGRGEDSPSLACLMAH
jgi:hypothetical protein